MYYLKFKLFTILFVNAIVMFYEQFRFVLLVRLLDSLDLVSHLTLSVLRATIVALHITPCIYDGRL